MRPQDGRSSAIEAVFSSPQPSLPPPTLPLLTFSGKAIPLFPTSDSRKGRAKHRLLTFLANLPPRLHPPRLGVFEQTVPSLGNTLHPLQLSCGPS